MDKREYIGQVTNTAVLKVKALRLRQAGLTYREIGEQLGIAHVTAHKYVTTLLKELSTESKEEAETLRNLELNRLDNMMKAIWPNVLKGKETAIDRALKIQERRAKLLGLDAPKQLEVDNKTIDITIKKKDAD